MPRTSAARNPQPLLLSSCRCHRLISGPFFSALSLVAHDYFRIADYSLGTVEREAPVKVDVERPEGRHRGSAWLRQSEFGITPVKVAGGTIKVKDEVRVDFEVVGR